MRDFYKLEEARANINIHKLFYSLFNHKLQHIFNLKIN